MRHNNTKNMSLADTVEMMVSDRPEDRLVAEYCQVSIRAWKLKDHLDELEYVDESDLSDIEKINFMQYKAMMMYIKDLKIKASMLGIEL